MRLLDAPSRNVSHELLVFYYMLIKILCQFIRREENTISEELTPSALPVHQDMCQTHALVCVGSCHLPWNDRDLADLTRVRAGK